MHLKEKIELTEFLLAVKQCEGDVLFETEDGDSLNLKSFLSEYLFSMIASNKNYVLSGRVVCRTEEDYGLLQEFIE